LALALTGGGFFLGVTLADDIKRSNCVKVCFSDRAFIDLGRIAARQDRSVPDLIHVLVRRHLYGHLALALAVEEGPEQANDGQ
jgi:hypothetical protein